MSDGRERLRAELHRVQIVSRNVELALDDPHGWTIEWGGVTSKAKLYYQPDGILFCARFRATNKGITVPDAYLNYRGEPRSHKNFGLLPPGESAHTSWHLGAYFYSSSAVR